MGTVTVKDGTTISYKDWGKGPAVTFSHGWPLNSDAWDGQMLFLAQRGFRVRAAQIVEYGPPSVIQVANIPRPQRQSGQLLVRVKAAGAGPWDALVREGSA